MKRRQINKTLIASPFFGFALAGCGGGGKDPSVNSISNPNANTLQGGAVKFGESKPTDAEKSINRTLSTTSSAATVAPPRKVDLSGRFLPSTGNQGSQSSCTAWATGYGAATFCYNKGRNLSATTSRNIASPADLYAKLIADGNITCNTGTDIFNALRILKDQGCDSLQNSPYNATIDGSVCAIPSAGDTFRISGFHRYDPVDSISIKKELESGRVLPFGMQLFVGFPLIAQSPFTNTLVRVGGDVADAYHAMLLIGYDDDLSAWRILNSWGDNWGDAGQAWLDYEVFRTNAFRIGAAVPVSYVTNTPPALTLVRTTGASIPVNKPYALTMSATDSDGNLNYIDLNWNDGTQVERYTVGAAQGAAATIELTRSFSSARTIQWSATAYDSSGRSSNVLKGTFVVTAAIDQGSAPSLLLSSDGGSSIVAGQSYSLAFVATDIDSDLRRIVLDWNDGSAPETRTISGSSATAVFSKPFTIPSTVSATAVAYDSKGLASSAVRQTFSVKAVPLLPKSAPVLLLSATSSTNVEVGTVYTVSLYSTDTDGNLSSTTIDWGDGGSSVSKSISGSSAYATFEKSFSNEGIKTWSATTFDASGLSSNVVRGTVQVNARAPAPVLFSTAPDALLAQSSAQTVTFFGSNFTSNTTIRWRSAGRSGALVASMVSSTELRVSVTTQTNGSGYWYFTAVTDVLASNEISVLCRAIAPPAPPAITSILPSAFTFVEGGITQITFGGSGFTASTTVKFRNNNGSGTISPVRVQVSPTQVSVGLVNYVPGFWYFSVSNENGNSNEVSSYSNEKAILQITGFNRGSIAVSNTLQNLTIFGYGFRSTTVVHWQNGSKAGTISAARTTIGNSTQIFISFTTSTAGAGTWYFYVTDAGLPQSNTATINAV